MLLQHDQVGCFLFHVRNQMLNATTIVMSDAAQVITIHTHVLFLPKRDTTRDKTLSLELSRMLIKSYAFRKHVKQENYRRLEQDQI